MNFNSNEIVELLNKELSVSFSDYRGAYFFGSRKTGDFNPDSDYDLVLIFDEIDYEKQLKVAGVIAKFEYLNDVYIDFKLFTSSGNSSIQYIREHINPVFIHNAIDNGLFYGKI